MVLTPSNKPRLFRLVLSDPLRPSYSSGDKVSGLVQLEAAAPCRLTRLRVTAAGCARVERRGGSKRSRVQEVEYLKCEEEVRLEEELSADSENCFLLPPGKTFSFQFGFELPPPGHLVSSYRGKFGSVRYYIHAELQRPNQDPLHCEQEFEVQEQLDVNQTHLLAPAAASKQKKVTCMFIPDGQVSISAQIDRRGYCEGEDIQINARFENTCSRIVVPKAAIICKHSYSVNSSTKELRQKLSAVRGNPIISGMCDMWQGRSIRVPKLQPTLRGCDIIKVDYTLMIYLHVPGSEKLVLELPLVIGTIPFSGVGSRTSSMSSQVGSTCSLTSFPSSPPSYSSFQRDLRVEGPHTPLLHDYDGAEDDQETGLFMRVPEVCYPPPPSYTVDQSLATPPQELQVF
ncbi:Thioredoxin-interacting protein [Oryzias melastigma]|uniref:Thioredoxin-interacting protein n=1 Tax=Oryzias melastigma TaxID=30732 RepID=A0A834FGB5_ORYME|nr:thioredoxin-interacting protein [Oryzias melastigma]KAF6731912.1 Thioredoxin-interacting protein [Oryzias melastigma]